MPNCTFGRTILQDPAETGSPVPVDCPYCGSKRRPLVETKKRPTERWVAVFPTHVPAGQVNRTSVPRVDAADSPAAPPGAGAGQRHERPVLADEGAGRGGKSAAGPAPGDVVRFRDWSGSTAKGKVKAIRGDVAEIWDDTYAGFWSHLRFLPKDRIVRVTSKAAA